MAQAMDLKQDKWEAFVDNVVQVNGPRNVWQWMKATL